MASSSVHVQLSELQEPSRFCILTSAFAVLAHPRAFHSSAAGTDNSPSPAPDQGQFDISPDAPGFTGASVTENPSCFASTQHIVVVWKAVGKESTGHHPQAITAAGTACCGNVCPAP